ncbi:MAG: sulfatase [Candidatus Binatia bacterium]|nr:sulfatase [Candidatus Binatia bacterium]
MSREHRSFLLSQDGNLSLSCAEKQTFPGRGCCWASATLKGSRLAKWCPGFIIIIIALALVPLLPRISLAARPHVVWVVVDSLRWDHVDVYEPSAHLTPSLLQRAQSATVFWQAYAPSSWTVPSVASLFSAKYPSLHGATRFGAAPTFDDNSAALAFARSGYRTLAISANAFVARSSIFSTGFATFVDTKDLLGPDRKGKVRAEEALRVLDQWLSEHQHGDSSPLFLYLHLMDPHWPYGPKDEFFSQVLPRYGEPERLRKLTGELYFGQLRLDGNVPPEARNAVRALYAGEVLATDRALADLFDVLERHGIAKHMLLIITADHGEELFDHDHIGHGRTLYEEVVRVPLLTWFPGQKQRVDVHTPVSLIDILPTSLEVAGVQRPRASLKFNAISLAGCAPASSWLSRIRKWIARERCGEPHRAVFAELLPLRAAPAAAPKHRAAVVQGRYKLLIALDRTIAAFGLGNTLQEVDGTVVPAERLEELKSAWTAFQEQLAAAPRAVPIVTPDAATREQLRALGYGD